MTSIPASRKQRATTLTPRSCPSSPTFAIRIRVIFGSFRTTTNLSNLLIRVGNLASGCEPHPLVLLEVRDRFFEVGSAPRLSHEKRMKRNSHDARGLLAVGVERIELVRQRAQVLIAGIAQPVDQRHVVDVHAVGNGE